jgi:Tetracyclin repressor-like, C-terminal domain
MSTRLTARGGASVIWRCEQALAEAGSDPAARFRNLIECLALYMASHRKSAAMDAEIRALSPPARKQYSAQRHQVEQMLVETIDQGVAAGVFEVTSPRDTGRALLGMVQAITLWFDPERGQLTAAELAARYVDIASHTVALRSSSGEQALRLFARAAWFVTGRKRSFRDVHRSRDNHRDQSHHQG